MPLLLVVAAPFLAKSSTCYNPILYFLIVRRLRRDLLTVMGSTKRRRRRRRQRDAARASGLQEAVSSHVPAPPAAPSPHPRTQHSQPRQPRAEATESHSCMYSKLLTDAPTINENSAPTPAPPGALLAATSLPTGVFPRDQGDDVIVWSRDATTQTDQVSLHFVPYTVLGQKQERL